jgi:hypothetical protein
MLRLASSRQIQLRLTRVHHGVLAQQRCLSSSRHDEPSAVHFAIPSSAARRAFQIWCGENIHDFEKFHLTKRRAAFLPFYTISVDVESSYTGLVGLKEKKRSASRMIWEKVHRKLKKVTYSPESNLGDELSYGLQVHPPLCLLTVFSPTP